MSFPRRLSRWLLVGAVTLGVLVALGGTAASSGSKDLSPRVDALLVLRHPGGLARFVRRVSNPSSPRYRDYLGVSRLVHRFGASRSTRRKALGWLSEHGLDGRIGPTGTYALAAIPAARADRLLGPGTRARRSGDSDPTAVVSPGRVPRSLDDVVERVGLLSTRPSAFGAASAHPVPSDPGAQIPPLPPRHGSMRDRTGTPAGCPAGRSAGFVAPDSAFTPNQYLTAYGHSKLHAAGLRGRGARVSFVEIDGFKRSDVKTFGACFGFTVPPIHVHPVGGPVLSPSDETTLDLEMFSAAAPRAESMDVYEGSSSAAGILETSAAALGRRGRRPDVISISLEGCEPRYVGSRVFAEAYNNVFAVAAGAGISTLVAAGDQGSSMCTEGTTALGLLATSIPATLPYVTAVGGTNLVLNARNEIVNELVWNDSPEHFAGGGGGYSLLFAKPWWQKVASTDDARAVPDVAALADLIPGFGIYCTAPACQSAPQETTPGWIGIGGTSAATPLLAGGIALANQSARRHHQPPLGFLNPLLYRIGHSGPRASAFRDLRRGDNDLGAMIPPAAGGGAPLGCCSARPGFDLASGWGSPKLATLERIARRAGRRR
jgi:subtilase family serine protease